MSHPPVSPCSAVYLPIPQRFSFVWLLVLALAPLRVMGDIHYVSLAGGHIPPFTSWANAATTIQHAIDMAKDGDSVLVTNGMYEVGALEWNGHSNRIVVPGGITVRSVNGPSVTTIRGAGPSGSNAVRCAYLKAGARLEGFTLTNGHTRTAGDLFLARSGGGIYAETGAWVSNSVVIGNRANHGGGGQYGGNAVRSIYPGNEASDFGGGMAAVTGSLCEIRNNSATASAGSGGGASDCYLTSSLFLHNTAELGGGASGGRLEHCTIISNTAAYHGGGAAFAGLRNCLLTHNTAGRSGGGARDCDPAESCTIAMNRSHGQDGFTGGGVRGCPDVRSSIVYSNRVDGLPEGNSGHNYSDSTFAKSCSYPTPSGGNNIGSYPKFIALTAGDFRLQETSPCRNDGVSREWMVAGVDLDGNPRLIGESSDMGAYERGPMLVLRLYLQGAFDTNLNRMASALTNGVLPRTSPYAVDARTIAAFPPLITDWVAIQLHATPTSPPLVAKSALLRRNGYVVSEAGTTGIFSGVEGSYYVAVSHRNHLGIMSASPKVFADTSITVVDFTGSSNQYYGSQVAVQMKPGYWGMLAGDADGDGAVRGADALIRQTQAYE